MNKLIPTECYVEVDVAERSPKENGKYNIIVNCGVSDAAEYYFLNKETYFRWFDRNENAIDSEVKSWLEKKSDMIVLSKDDLTVLLSMTFLEGHKNGLSGYLSESDHTKYAHEEYIKSLFK